MTNFLFSVIYGSNLAPFFTIGKPESFLSCLICQRYRVYLAAAILENKGFIQIFPEANLFIIANTGFCGLYK